MSSKQSTGTGSANSQEQARKCPPKQATDVTTRSASLMSAPATENGSQHIDNQAVRPRSNGDRTVVADLQVEKTPSTTAGGGQSTDLNLPILEPKPNSRPTSASSEANSPLSEKGRELVRRFDEQLSLKEQMRKHSSTKASSTPGDEQYGTVVIDPHWCN